MKVTILLLSAFVGSALSWGGYKLNFEYSDLEYDENLLNVELQMKRSGDRTIVNARTELFEDVDTEIVVHASHYEKVGNDYQHLVNASISACNILSRVKAHPILKIVLKELLKSSNVPTSCPIKKGLFFMKDFSVNDDLLPPFLPIGNFMSKVRIARVIDGEEVPALKMTIFADIGNAKGSKSSKLF